MAWHQDNTKVNVDTDLCRHMASLGYNDLRDVYYSHTDTFI